MRIIESDIESIIRQVCIIVSDLSSEYEKIDGHLVFCALMNQAKEINDGKKPKSIKEYFRSISVLNSEDVLSELDNGQMNVCEDVKTKIGTAEESEET